MNNTKKLKLYELDPRFFKDLSGNGTGDLKGLKAKIDYFKFLDVDAILLQNTLSSDSDDAVQNFTHVAKELGNVNDLTTIISYGNSQGTKVFLEIAIGSIKESHKWFANSESQLQDEFNGVVDFKSSKAESTTEMKYSQNVKGYYAFDKETQEVPLNWKSEKVLEQFVKVIRYWTDLGVTGFVFKDFEYIGEESKEEAMSPATLKELRKFYRAIKEIDDSITIIGKSPVVSISNTNEFTEGSTKVFDYFMSQQISLLGTSAKFGNDQIGKFKASHLASSIKKYVNDSSNILTFGSDLTGRINSRWGDHGQFSLESSKALGMLLTLTPASFSIYYGDEIGTLNIGLTHLDNFQDKTLVARRKEFATGSNLKEEDFMKAQVVQNPINSRSLMAWNDQKNGGFSNAEKTITPVNSTYKEINVANQYDDQNSTLNFYKELLRIVTSTTYASIIRNGKFTISSLIPGVIKMVSKLDEREVRVYVNLTNKTRKIIKAKAGKVIVSTHPHKSYKELPNTLEAFEGIVISKATDEIIRKTQQIKIKSKKEQEKFVKIEAKEVQRIELEKQKAEQEALRVKAEAAAAKAQAKEAAKAQKEEEAIAAQQAKEEAEQAKLQAKLAAQAEKEAQVRAAAEAKEAEGRALAEQLAREEKEKARAQREADKVAARAEREAEKTRVFELKVAEKEAKRAAKLEEKDELARIKEAAKAERAASKLLKEGEAKFSIMEEEVLESERTTLTEDDIAPTTQIDTDNLDDFEAFLNSDKK